MVEAPGTAPGSEWFITMSLYRHIRDGSLRTGNPNINTVEEKSKCGFGAEAIEVTKTVFRPVPLNADRAAYRSPPRSRKYAPPPVTVPEKPLVQTRSTAVNVSAPKRPPLAVLAMATARDVMGRQRLHAASRRRWQFQIWSCPRSGLALPFGIVSVKDTA